MGPPGVGMAVPPSAMISRRGPWSGLGAGATWAGHGFRFLPGSASFPMRRQVRWLGTWVVDLVLLSLHCAVATGFALTSPNKMSVT